MLGLVLFLVGAVVGAGLLYAFRGSAAKSLAAVKAEVADMESELKIAGSIASSDVVNIFNRIKSVL